MLHPLVGMQKRGRLQDAKLKTPMGTMPKRHTIKSNHVNSDSHFKSHYLNLVQFRHTMLTNQGLIMSPR